MSKAKIVASVAASAVLAGLPAVATFAEAGDINNPSAQTDELRVTVPVACEFGFWAGQPTVALGSHTNGSNNNGSWTTHAMTITPSSTERIASAKVVDKVALANALEADLSTGSDSTYTLNYAEGKWVVDGTTTDVTAFISVVNQPDKSPTAADTLTVAVEETASSTTALATGYDILSGTLMAGTKSENFGQTTLNVVCNNAEGYHITSEATNLIGKDKEGATITSPAHDIVMGNALVDDSGNPKSTWSYKLVEKDADMDIVNGVFPNFVQGTSSSTPSDWAAPTATAKPILKNEAANAFGPDTQVTTESATFRYGVGVSSQQEAGVYTGHITYRLIAGQPTTS